MEKFVIVSFKLNRSYLIADQIEVCDDCMVELKIGVQEIVSLWSAVDNLFHFGRGDLWAVGEVNTIPARVTQQRPEKTPHLFTMIFHDLRPVIFLHLIGWVFSFTATIGMLRDIAI